MTPRCGGQLGDHSAVGGKSLGKNSALWGLSRASGFLARFLVSQPASLQGTRAYRESGDMVHLAAFNARIAELLEIKPTIEEDEADAVALDRWLLDRARMEGKDHFPVRVVLQHCPYAIRKREAFDKAAAILAAHDRVREVTRGKRRLLMINPALLVEGAEGDDAGLDDEPTPKPAPWNG
jgi:uncharacterized protein DUF3987